MWSVVNQFQTLMFLLLTKAYFPEETTIGFTGFGEYISFSFNFIPYSALSFVKPIKDWLDQPVNGDLMQKVGLNSGSTFINNISLLVNVVLIVLLHSVFLVVKRTMSVRCAARPCVKFVVDKVYRLLTL